MITSDVNLLLQILSEQQAMKESIRRIEATIPILLAIVVFGILLGLLAYHLLTRRKTIKYL